MKREQIKELFPELSDEQVDKLFSIYGQDVNPLKEQLAKTTEERDELKTNFETVNENARTLKTQLVELQGQLEENMSVEERIAAREKAAEDREREYILKSNALEAKTIFVQSGFLEASEIDELVAQVACADNEMTKANAQRIVDTINKQREAVADATKAELLKSNPKLGGSGKEEPGVPSTMKEFLALSLTEQLELKASNPNILSELKREN